MLVIRNFLKQLRSRGSVLGVARLLTKTLTGLFYVSHWLDIHQRHAGEKGQPDWGSRGSQNIDWLRQLSENFNQLDLHAFVRLLLP